MASSVRCVSVLLLAIPACAVGSKWGDFECDPATDRTCDVSHQTTAADAGHPHDAATHYDSASVYDAAEPLDSATIDASARDSAITQQCALGLATGMPACDTCLGAHCCAEDNACANGRDCTSYIQCGNGCFAVDGGPTQACFDQCATQYPSGSALMNALTSCMSASCNTECSGP